MPAAQVDPNALRTVVEAYLDRSIGELERLLAVEAHRLTSRGRVPQRGPLDHWRQAIQHLTDKLVVDVVALASIESAVYLALDWASDVGVDSVLHFTPLAIVIAIAYKRAADKIRSLDTPDSS